MTDVLLCVGNSMMGDDGAGPLLAEKCAAAPKGNWNAFDKARAAQTSQQKEWSTMLLSMLHDIHQENAIYLMVRRLRD